MKWILILSLNGFHAYSPPAIQSLEFDDPYLCELAGHNWRNSLSREQLMQSSFVCTPNYEEGKTEFPILGITM